MTRYESLPVFFLRTDGGLRSIEHKSWPNLVGKPVDEAVEEIKQENSGQTPNPSIMGSIYLFSCLDYQVEKLAVGSFVTRDLRLNRVRVFYDEENKVASPPATG